MKKNILMLGGFGFLGKNLIEVFKNKYNIIVFDHLKNNMDSVISYSGDFSNANDLEIIFINHRIDLVFHLISNTTPGSSNKDIVYDIEKNLISTINLLELMKKYSIPKIVFTSSGGTIYGKINSPNGFAMENDPTFPICSHGICKLAIERYIYLFSYLYGIDYLILRISNLYGKYHTSNNLGFINVSLRKILSEKKMEVWGNGEIIRDYIFVEDCVQIIRDLLEKNVNNEVFNIGSGEGHSINEIINIIRGFNCDFTIEYKKGRNFDVDKVILSIKKLKRINDFQFTNIEDGIKKTITWMNKDGE